MADAAFWDGIAEEYAAKPVELPEAFERKIAITLDAMAPTDTVLDIGCGTGSLVLRLAGHAEQLHGLDISGEMVRIARGKAAGIDNVTFHQGVLDDVPFDAGQLQGICAYSILHLVDDRERTLRQIFELLEPGGFFISSTVCIGGQWLFYAPMLTVMRWFGKAPMVDLITQEQLEADVRNAGFVDLTFPDVGAKSTTAFLVCRKPEAVG